MPAAAGGRQAKTLHGVSQTSRRARHSGEMSEPRRVGQNLV